MMLDIKTLMFLYLIINIISAGAMAVIWSQNRGRFAGISFWLADMILQAVGSALIVLRGLIPDLVSMVLANILIQAGALIILIGLERFTGKKGWQIHNYVLLLAFIAVFTYYVLVQPDLRAREIALSAMSMILTFQCFWLLLRRIAPGMRQITRLTGIVFAGYAAFSFARIIMHIVFPAQTNDFFKSGAVDALAITVYIVLSVCLVISLVLMVSRRLLADVKAQEDKFTAAFHSSPYAITITRPADGTIFEVNDGFVDMIGYQYTEVIGRSTLDLQLWVNREDRLAVVNELAQGREVHAMEYQFRKKTGEVLTGLFSASQVTINNETCILSSIGDITERKQVENELNMRAQLLNSVNDFIALHDMEGNFIYANEAHCVSHGYSREELMSMNIKQLNVPEYLELVQRRMEEIIDKGSSMFETAHFRKDGSILPLEIHARMINTDGTKLILSIARDITERKQLQQNLEEMATHDFLTGLPNRVLLVDRFTIAAALARRNKSRLAVMSLDLDKFKTINDTLGHDAGDQALKLISTGLEGILRASDTLARVGGDEFILVMQEANQREDATVIAQKILDFFMEPLSIDGHQLHLSTSIGIAISPEDGEDLETLTKKSDSAMYYSKGHGRNQFKFFGDGDVRMGGDQKSANT